MHVKSDKCAQLQALLRQRIVVLDGPRGTMIQALGLSEAQFRNARFKNHVVELKGNNDILNLTQPEIVYSIHCQFIESGADIIGTNTFNANRISQAEYRTAHLVPEINREGARIARRAADQFGLSKLGRQGFVAGAIGPTSRSASLPPEPSNPAARAVTFDELADAYYEQVSALVAGGVDILLIETVFDTLNAKACLFAILKLYDELGRRLPLMISATLGDASGRTLSGQTLEAFWHSVRHAEPLSVGLNCAFGAAQMGPHLEELSAVADCYISCYPNAGLPDAFGRYCDTPEQMAGLLGQFARDGLVNIVGGCCGSTPAHIKAIAEAVRGVAPRVPPKLEPCLRLSGLEPLTIRANSPGPGVPSSLGFVVVGERTSVAGSPKFARHIQAGEFELALAIARQQVEQGAQVLDVNMDAPMLDGVAAMRHFLYLLGADPAVARVPVMIDSSNWAVIEAGLKCLQGKGVVNSISLKDGEERFLERARLIRRYGAVPVVSAFDERGQADTFERKIEICRRSYKLLVERAGIPAEEIIFDPMVLPVGTGIEAHNNHAVDFLRATRWIKQNLPLAKVIGGISNVSFSFRGNEPVRKALNSAFLFHALEAGLDLAIVNAGALSAYEEIPRELRELAEGVLLNRRPDATERLIEFGQQFVRGAQPVAETKREESWRRGTVEERLEQALIRGIDEYIPEDISEALRKYGTALAVIEGPLMAGMRRVGELFGAGRMFLPQVIKSARVMKKAVEYLRPYLEAGSDTTSGRTKGKVLLATVKGDVHDIGKNIVGVVLACNNYDVIDLGVMVPAARILEAARAESVDAIGLSGLITPSLDEMVHVARELNREGFKVPLLIGGATTSKVHTAVMIAPAYAGPVVHVPDASQAVPVLGNLLSPSGRREFVDRLEAEYAEIRAARTGRKPRLLSLAEARANAPKLTFAGSRLPIPTGVWVIQSEAGDAPCALSDLATAGHARFTTQVVSLNELVRQIDWTPFFHAWELPGSYPSVLSDPVHGPAAQKLFADAQRLLERILTDRLLVARGVYGIFRANSVGDDIEVYADDACAEAAAIFHFLRQQERTEPGRPCLCLADFVAPKLAGAGGVSEGRSGGTDQVGMPVADYIGAFALTTGHGLAELVEQLKREHDDYTALLAQALADRLVEAFAELVHKYITVAFGLGTPSPDISSVQSRGIRPAIGYPIWPDHSEKRILWKLLDVEQNAGIELTETCMMRPASSVCGLVLMHPEARYFAVGKIGRDQVADYAARKRIPLAEAEKWLAQHLGYAPGAEPRGEPPA